MAVHPDYDPRRRGSNASVEANIVNTLKRLGSNVRIVAMTDDADEAMKSIGEFNPDIVFNLLEEFRGHAVFDFHLVTMLEARGIAYTGCNPRGLVRTRSKFGVYSVAAKLGVRCGDFFKWSSGPRVKARFDSDTNWIVKLDREHASLGLTQKSQCRSWLQARRAAAQLRRYSRGEILVQEFVAGREVSVSVIGNDKLQIFEPWELRLPTSTTIATEKIKFNPRYRRSLGIRACRYLGEPHFLKDHSAELFRTLELSGYARFDYRIDPEGHTYLIDVNPNPNLAMDEDVAYSAKNAGMSYLELIESILRLGRDYRVRI